MTVTGALKCQSPRAAWHVTHELNVSLPIVLNLICLKITSKNRGIVQSQASREVEYESCLDEQGFVDINY